MRPDILQRHLLRPLCLLLLLSLGACASWHRDGPPRGRVDVSMIPDAVPKVEPKSRSGNAPSYVVYGRTYHVRSSSLNYAERGIASWYGTKFDAQPTSSGEIYDMLGMTAAHKTLPLPTYAEVTNLANHKSVIVKINDRGPFAQDRLIDLSYAAAKKLGMTGRGTAYVEVKAINPREYSLARRETARPSPFHFQSTVASLQRNHPDRFFVQVGTFQNRKFAERLKNRLNHLVQSPVQISLPRGKQNFYRVEIGPLVSPVAVSLIRHQLKTAGITQSNIIRMRSEG